MQHQAPNPSVSTIHRPILAIVCGLPATGKTTLARNLHDALGWPLLSKDDLKELLFDAGDVDHGTFTRSRSMVIGRQAMALLFRLARQILAAGHDCMVEANFLPHLAPADFEPLMALADVRQVHCTAPDSLVLTRYESRARDGHRHPVHADVAAIDDLVARIAAGAGQPLPLSAPLLEVETTNGYQPDLARIVAFLTREGREPCLLR